jgi:hypothetical protein
MANKKTLGGRAQKYGCSIPTMKNWLSEGFPDDGGHADLEWLKTRTRLPAKTKALVAKHLKATQPKRPSKKRKKSEAKTAEELRDEYFAELQTAKDAFDEEREKIALNAYLKIDKQIREAEAHAKKLGLDRGEMLSRDEVCRIVRASTYAGNACIEGTLEQISEKVSAMETPEQVYNFLKPIILGGRLFAGFSKVAKTPGEVNLPEWLCDIWQTSADDYLKGVKLK